MRTTAERLAAAKRRARELERERQRRRARGILCAGTAACFAVIVSLALVMPGITEGFSDTALGGGMAVQRAVAEKWKKVTGVTLVEAYGLTETSPAACIHPMDLKDYNGAIGLPIPSTDVCLKDDDGNILTVLGIPMAWQYMPLSIGSGAGMVFVAYDLYQILCGKSREERYGVDE